MACPLVSHPSVFAFRGKKITPSLPTRSITVSPGFSLSLLPKPRLLKKERWKSGSKGGRKQLVSAIMASVDSQPTWTELLGSNDWSGLLNPLDLSLRKLILRCGDFCQATYDAFNGNTNSRFCGSSNYGKKSFFHKVCLPSASDYQVLAFLYATSTMKSIEVPEDFIVHPKTTKAWDTESNWIGYIAATTDQVSKVNGRREVYVVWRGTIRTMEWIDVFEAKQVPATPLFASGNAAAAAGDAKVMLGWLTIYTSCNPDSPFTKTSAQTQVRAKIKELVNRYRNESLSLTFVGHSLGASLAVLSALDVVENIVADVPIAAIVFGCPMLGNKAFCEELGQKLRILHVKNVIDLIPHYPGLLLGGYAYAGTDLEIDTRKSPSLKDSKNPSDWHNLQGMLHVVAGWNGSDGEFELKVKRSLALVNKSCDFLKEEFYVPESWWIEKNKGMVLDEHGDWVQALPFEEDIPVPEF